MTLPRRSVPPLLVVVALGLAAIGCGADASDLTSGASDRVGAAVADPPAMTLRASDDGSALLLGDGADLRVLDPSTAAERFRAPGGIASGDGRLVVSAEPSGAGSTVVARSVLDGSARWSAAVPARLDVVGVSLGGETVALVDPSAPDGTTAFVVVRFALPTDPSGSDSGLVLPEAIVDAPLPSSQRYDVAGRLEFDGFSDTTAAMFVLQRSVVDDDAYQVRLLDLALGSVQSMSTRDKVVPEGEMYGRFRSSIRSPGRGEIATLYTVAGSGTSGAAFVHLLNTAGNYADCLDLPAPLGRGEPSTLAIAAVPPGAPLLVYDSTAGAVAALDPDELGSVTVFETSDPALRGGRPAAIAATRDDVVVASGDLVVVHDLLGRPRTSWSAGGEVGALAAIASSGHLAMVVGGAVRIVDRDGTVLAAVPLDSDPPPTFEVLTPPPASTVAPPTSVVDALPVVPDAPPTVGSAPSVPGTVGP